MARRNAAKPDFIFAQLVTLPEHVLARKAGIDMKLFEQYHGAPPTREELIEIIHEHTFEAVPLSQDELRALKALDLDIPHRTHTQRLYRCSLCNPALEIFRSLIR